MVAGGSKPHKARLDTTGDVLIGVGEREVKLGFVHIHVYSLGMYVDPDACRDCLLDAFGDVDHNGLLSDPTFHPAFVSGHFRKTFHLTFCRTLGKEKLVGGFADALRSRCDEAHLGDADLLLSNLVPASGVVDDDMLTLVCEGDGKTLKCMYTAAGGDGEEKELIKIESGGERGAWRALQNIYFDEDTALPTIKQSAVADLPNVLVGRADDGEEEDIGGGDDTKPSHTTTTTSIEGRKSAGRQPSAKEIEDAVEEQFVQGGRKKGHSKQTWSEFAGRDPKNGGTGYKFGDVTLGVATAMGLRKKQQPSSSSQPSDTAGGSGHGTRSIGDDVGPADVNSESTKLPEKVKVLEQDRKKLEKEGKKLEVRSMQLQRDLGQAERRLAEAELLLPVKIMCALFVAELVGLVMSLVVTDASVASVARLVLYTLGGIGAGMRFKKIRHDGTEKDVVKAKSS